MAKTTIKLADITADSTISVNDKVVYTLSAGDVSVKSATANGYGNFKWNAATDIVFTADAALSGEISLASGATTISVVGADFSKTTAGISFTNATGDGVSITAVTGGSGNDTINGAIDGSYNAGAGDDLVSIGGGTSGSNVTLGAGADTLVVSGGKASVADYNYFDGDVIKLVSSGSAVASTVALNSDGKMTVGAASSGGDSVFSTGAVGVQDNWYAAKVIGSDSVVVDYFTAVGGNNVNVTKDLSKSVIKNVVDASGAASANITLGHGDDEVKLGAGVDTIVLGKSSGSNTLSGFNSSDVIAIDGVKLSDITLGLVNTSDIGLTYAATTVDTGVVSVTGGASLNFSDGNQKHKLAYATSDSAVITYATSSDADWFVGVGSATKLEVGGTTHLHDTDKYQNIQSISVSSDAKLTEAIYLTGAVGKKNTIDASKASVGVGVWGYSTDNDAITLGSAQDTVYFGTTDGNDTISGFKFGSATDSDILYLYDTKELGDIKVVGGSSATSISAGKKATASVTAATGATNDIALIQLADGNVYTVAGAYHSSDTVTINTDETKLLNYYAFDTAKAQTVSITGKEDFIFNSLYTDFMTAGATVGAINASASAGDVTLAGATSIVGGTGVSNIWTYQSDTKANVTLQSGAGTDNIWFAEGFDQQVSVTGFDTKNDTAKFALADSLKDIAENYTFAGTDTDVSITGVNHTDSQLILTGAKNGTAFNIADGAGNNYKALTGSTSAASTFTTDVNIYAGMTSLNAGSALDGEVVIRVGKESRGVASENYYIDDSVKVFDASKSTAKFIIAGSSEVGNTITGGLTENLLYGGGASSDVLKGSVAAVDTFFFGTGDGNDTIAAGVDAADTVALWNVDDADIANVTVTLNKDGKSATVVLSDTSTLNFTADTNAAQLIKDGLSFTSATNTAYKYDSETGKLVAKA